MRSTSQRQSAAQTRLLLLVKEAGSEPLTPVLCDRFDKVVVVVQLAGEPPIRFAQRVLERLVTIERSGERIESARLLLRQSTGPADRASRRLVALGLATHAVVHRDLAELVLERPTRTAPGEQAELFELAEELMLAMPGGVPLPVRVRIGVGRGSQLAKTTDTSEDTREVRYA
jgi:hypothetical protein